MNKLRKLFSDYVREKSTKEEKEIIDLWFQEKAKSPIDLVSEDEKEQFSQRMWEEFLASGRETKAKHVRILRISYGMIGVAGIVLLFLLLTLPDDKHMDRERIEIGATRQFVADDNMKRLTLADRSVIHMNKGTIIELRDGRFSAYAREVWLEEGEAFFEVAKDHRRPFIVHTADGLSTRVIGTSFNIKAYNQLGEQVVSVKTGRVQVSSETGEKVILDVNHKASFHVATQQITTSVTDATGAADWRSGRIVLEHVSMDELAFRLKQYYDVEVVNNAVSDEMEIYTSFHISTPLEHVVNNVSKIFGVSYKIESGMVYFYNN